MATSLATAPRPAHTFSTTDVPSAQRLRAWEEHNAAALIALRCRTPKVEDFRAREDNLSLGRVQLARVRTTAHVVERPADLVERQPTGSVAIYVSLRGEALFQQAGGRRMLRPGDVLVCDADRHFVRGFGRGLDELAVRVDRRALPDVAVPGEPLIVRAGEANPYGRALARLVGRAVGVNASTRPDEQTVVDLASVLVSDGATRPPVLHRALACAHIEDRLRDPRLSAPEVADAVGISVRQLTRVFAEVGTTFPRHVLGRRLELAYGLLSGPDAAATRTATVAADCGFTSVAHFSQTFHARFGSTAGEVRRTTAKRGDRQP
ncbi:helix-turn-helix domain-containing protein [Streptomyces griseorubiginosus]|uniref:helix-turn-helix domain-containing protein n=1 Tax=Streptomyces griseorubiginosus TaxID=67304 RepID=UPI001AD6C089|nr:helix-turn-helix domain-containing protein [Streptomyces griseorubiginosus]MBO4256955.1 helix-turn-helix domain-containing protein [Streptomyces griseorubiginosus]